VPKNAPPKNKITAEEIQWATSGSRRADYQQKNVKHQKKNVQKKRVDGCREKSEKLGKAPKKQYKGKNQSEKRLQTEKTTQKY